MDPIQNEKTRAQMNALANILDDHFNGERLPGLARLRKYGFALLVFEFGEVNAGRMNWISNAERADMIVALKEMVAQLEGRKHPKPEQPQ